MDLQSQKSPIVHSPGCKPKQLLMENFCSFTPTKNLLPVKIKQKSTVRKRPSKVTKKPKASIQGSSTINTWLTKSKVEQQIPSVETHRPTGTNLNNSTRPLPTELSSNPQSTNLVKRLNVSSNVKKTKKDSDCVKKRGRPKKSKVQQQIDSIENCKPRTSVNESNWPASFSTKSKNILSEKYKMLLPTLTTIKQYQQQLLKEQQLLNEFGNQVEIPLKIENISFHTPEISTNVLNCKHLNKDEIKYYFEKYSQYVEDIVSGVQYSVRHKKYLHCRWKQNHTVDDLTYNTSMIHFDYEQKRKLLRLLDKKFQNTIYEFIDDHYFLKVLLPELCKKIFADVHGMTVEDATVYLENVPLKPIV